MKIHHGGHIVQNEMFKNISLELLWSFCSAEQNHLLEMSLFNLRWPFCSAELNGLCKLRRCYYKEHFFDIILNLD